MNFGGGGLVAMLVTVSFAAGLNVYATVGTLGLLGRTGVISLPQSLSMLSSWWVIAASGVLFAIEFFADKIPVFDLIWNALHTFIRVPVAALLAYQATAGQSPGDKLIATLAGGAIALAAHTGKTAVRTAATASPEPVSNIALSTGEDVMAISLPWFGTHHPYWAAGIVVGFLVLIVLFIRWVVRSIKSLFRRTEGAFAKWTGAPS
jgi:hypothetical protein